ncbi:MAG: sulfurtransferase-like selenium metabolism protein YedF [Prolixibacteraceae bacterium]|nr:sulfurtransferase-like selenium metabolism protein YedF [Prolixibacteraceae bacterium]MBN2648818.1 sulfurtransferase-like selenium metabolism protein YedF [Prolixibacteraceae bacterium]
MNQKKTLIQINSDQMGVGSPELGKTLIDNYLKLIIQEEILPSVIVFYNSGVKLTCEDSTVLETLRRIEECGVKLVSCKTCLNHFNLGNKMQVGMAGTMIDIIALQNEAGKVITL